MISLVTEETLDSVWSVVRPQILKALSHGAGDTTTERHLYQMVVSGLAQVWVAHEEEIQAIIIISIKDYPNKKSVYVELCAGKELDKWIDDIHKNLRDYRDMIGADTIETCARKGLTKLKDWKIKAYLMELT